VAVLLIGPFRASISASARAKVRAIVVLSRSRGSAGTRFVAHGELTGSTMAWPAGNGEYTPSTSSSRKATAPLPMLNATGNVFDSSRTESAAWPRRRHDECRRRARGREPLRCNAGEPKRQGRRPASSGQRDERDRTGGAAKARSRWLPAVPQRGNDRDKLAALLPRMPSDRLHQPFQVARILRH